MASPYIPIAARLAKQGMAPKRCSKCRRWFLSKRRQRRAGMVAGDFYASCPKCISSGRARKDRDSKLSADKKLARKEAASARMKSSRAAILRDPVLKKMLAEYVEYEPIQPSKLKPKHSPDAVKAVCRLARLARKPDVWGI